eukprot:12245900-Alexandrium_andersonii.AAC.1
MSFLNVRGRASLASRSSTHSRGPFREPLRLVHSLTHGSSSAGLRASRLQHPAIRPPGAKDNTGPFVLISGPFRSVQGDCCQQASGATVMGSTAPRLLLLPRRPPRCWFRPWAAAATAAAAARRSTG